MTAAARRAAAPKAVAAPDPGFGIYIHWPFCLAKCPYCDFNSHVREGIDQTRWRRALVAELEHYAALAPGRRVISVFFGGGTPSLMDPETAAALIERIGTLWDLAPDAEITLEANPTSVEAGRFAAFRAAGVTRVSLGVQALDAAALTFLGRRHGVAEALEAVALARRHFPRWSFDLIYARPGQTVAEWRAELTRALAEGPAHLSLYQLTIEPATAFEGKLRRGEFAMPADSRAAALWETTQEVMESAGLPAYEVSNHAAPGEACRHNLTYWRAGDWVGIGPGAHGRLTLADFDGGADPVRLATRQHRAPEAWLESVERDGHATRTREPLDRDARLAELVMMGLRLSEGIAREAFRRVLGREPEEVLSSERVSALTRAGYLELDEAGLRASPAGRRRLDSLLAYLL